MDIPLVLGGHSFISQLGADPAPSEDLQARIVAACLDGGIRRFDTTYRPERRALGKALERLGRRDEAIIIAWNFFADFGPGEETGGPEAYRPEHIGMMLDDLRTDRIDRLVVHPVGEERGDRLQEETAVGWMEAGLVGELGTWWPEADAREKFGRKDFYSFMVRPYNVATRDGAAAFAAAKSLGWENLACSPFVRGWELAKLAGKAAALEGGGEGVQKERLAGLMLRYSMFAENVDRLIVAMRKEEWVRRNIEQCRGGPLCAEESEWLLRLAAAGE